MTMVAEGNRQLLPTAVEAAAKVRASVLLGVRLRWISAHAAVRALAAAPLLASAGLKASQMIEGPLSETTVPLLSASIAEMWWWEVGIVVGQLVLAVALLAPIGQSIAWITWQLAGIAYGTFIAASLLRIATGQGSGSCACFGAYELNAYFSAAISLAVLAGIVLFPPSMAKPQTAPQPRAKWPRLLVASVTALVLALGAAAALNLYRPEALHADSKLGQARAILLRPSDWVGQRCPLLEHVTIDAQLDQGRWIVILARSGCPSCQDVLPQYQEFAGQMSSPKQPLRVAVIEANEEALYRRAIAMSHTSRSGVAGPVVGHLEGSRRWHANLPVVMLLFDGVLEVAIEGAVSGSSAIMREFAPVSQIASASATPSTEPPTLVRDERPELPPSRAPGSQ
jgi:hypothetical protein